MAGKQLRRGENSMQTVPWQQNKICSGSLSLSLDMDRYLLSRGQMCWWTGVRKSWDENRLCPLLFQAFCHRGAVSNIHPMNIFIGTPFFHPSANRSCKQIVTAKWINSPWRSTRFEEEFVQINKVVSPFGVYNSVCLPDLWSWSQAGHLILQTLLDSTAVFPSDFHG